MKNNIVTRNNPFGLIDPFFDEFFTGESNSQFNQVMRTDIKDNGDHYEFKIEIPDIKKENINVSIEDGYLVIEAHQESNDDEKKHGRYVRKERYYGSYKRSFYVGDNVSDEDVKAKLHHGILTLLVNKKEDERVAKNFIQIE